MRRRLLFKARAVRSIDLVNVFRAPEYVPAIVDDVIRLHIPYLWLQDDVIHEEAVARARAAGVKCVQDDCIFRQHARLSSSELIVPLNTIHLRYTACKRKEQLIFIDAAITLILAILIFAIAGPSRAGAIRFGRCAARACAPDRSAADVESR